MAGALSAGIRMLSPICLSSAAQSVQCSHNQTTFASSFPVHQRFAKKTSPMFGGRTRGPYLSHVRQRLVPRRCQECRAALSSAEAGIATSDVETLNSKYGIPGSVSIEKGEGGSTKVVLSHESGAQAEVYLYGAVVTSWRLPNGKDYLYVRPDAKFDGSKPISGGIPHCFPQFGPGEMQQHGFARNLDWAIVSTSADANPDDPEPMLELLLTDNDYTRSMWPHEFAAVYQITLKSDALVAALRIINLDKEPFQFTAALHTYFRAAIEKVKVTGLKGLTKLNKDPDPKNPTESTEDREEVTFPGFVDVMYKDAPQELILDTGLGHSIALQSSGWKDAVTWNPYKTMESCYKEFVCVENAQLDDVVVKPNESWRAELRLQAQ